ncbi:MAG: hypothetical protein IJK89_12740 [Clostridia bacterium]|nr:hypothetical protein [Clostridia bacterium]
MVRWYDFVNDKAVKAPAEDRETRDLPAEIRFFGIFRKLLTDFTVLFAKVITGRTAGFPDREDKKIQ